MQLEDLDFEKLWELLRLRRKAKELPVKCLVELHRRGTREIFDRAVSACKSRDRHERTLGVRVLRELGGLPPRFAVEAQPFLLEMLEKELSPIVRRWIISALCYQNVETNILATQTYDRRAMKKRALSGVLPHANDRNASVRFAVAAALPALVDLQNPEDTAVEALIRLASDRCVHTRYYALAALVDDLGLSSRENVRTALEQRLNDHEERIRRCAQIVIAGGQWGS